MWGSTTSNTNTLCDWEHAPFNNGSTEYNEEYFNSVKDNVCSNGILAKEYDAARANMGGDWRMPTEAEIKELCAETNNGWTQVNDALGWKFTSKVDASKYIFIRVAEYRMGSSFTSSNYGAIWSSSLNTSDRSAACRLYFDYYGGVGVDNHFNRYFGFSVRGVL